MKIRDGRPVLLRQVAPVRRRAGSEARRQRRVRPPGGRHVRRRSGVVLTINKQPGADTRQLTEQVTDALAELQASLPPDVRIAPELYQQKQFIDLAIDNVDGRACATAASWW